MPKYHITSPHKPEGAVFDENQFAEFLVWVFKCQREDQTKELMAFRHELHEKGSHSFPGTGVEVTVMESA